MEQEPQISEFQGAPPAFPSWLFEAGWYGIGFAVFLALGLVNLFYPFGDDQAVLFFAARELSKGATLYVDYWGNKQPGLYAFYFLAGRIFGFSEQGVHLLELIWMSAFAFVLMVTLRPCFQARWLSSLAPLATIGVYYATAREDELTQLEMLVAFPLYLVAWTAVRAVQTPEDRTAAKRMAVLFFFGGLFAALATLFKLLLAPIPVAFWLIASAYLIRERKVSLFALVARVWVPVACGVMLPVSAVVLWFWQAGALQELLWTAFVYPPEAFMSSPQAPSTRLIIAAAFALTNTAPWLLFVVVAIAVWWRATASPMVGMMLMWVVLAVALVGIQRFSWWPYHTLLSFTPLGILAIFGIDHAARFMEFRFSEISRRIGGKVLPAMICTALFAIPLAASLTGPFLTKAAAMFTADERMMGDRLMAYHWKVNPKYKKIWESSLFLRGSGVRPGPIYSFGSAMVYSFTGRNSAHKTAGFSWEFYVPSQIEEILEALEAKQAPYIFIEKDKYRLFKQQPDVAAYITSNYIRLKKDDGGIWYERLQESSPPSLPSRGG